MISSWIIGTREEVKMSKADDMFERLGYKKISTLNDELKIAYKNTRGKTIMFSVCLQRVGLVEEYQWLTMQELQAINEKCKELGWNE